MPRTFEIREGGVSSVLRLLYMQRTDMLSDAANEAIANIIIV